MNGNRRKRAVRVAPLAIALLALASCRTATEAGPPEIVVDRTVCSHCGMLISDLAYAAAYRIPGSEGRVFDDIGCLLGAARQETAAGIRFWFHDAADARWIDGDPAAFVTAPSIRTPMGGGVIAYRDHGAAAQSAASHHGEVVRTLGDLLSRKGDLR